MSSSAKLVRETIAKHGNDRTRLLPILQDLVACRNYLTDDLLLELSRAMELPPAHVFGVASFYSFLPCR